MTSAVTLCNMALTRLGQQRILSLTQTGPGPELCNLFYAPTRQELISDYDWYFAITRKSLASSADTNLTNKTHMYQLPSDYQRILTIISSEDFSDTVDDWFIEDTFIYADVNPLYIKYIRDIDIVAKMPQLFIEALVLRLATKMCLKLTQDQNLFNTVMQEYGMAVQSAMSIIGGNTKKPKTVIPLWTDV